MPINNFIAPATNGLFKLADFAGSNLVLYFYPKDNTSGCTKQALGFAELHHKFIKANTHIVGVSRDNLKSHFNFKTKLCLPFELISDIDEAVCKLFDVIKTKQMYGRKYLGIERSTFLLDGKANLIKEWRKVKIPGHAEEVLSLAQTLSQK